MTEDYEKYQKYVDYVDAYRKASNAATGSAVDANANVETKNVTTLSNEMFKPEEIGVCRKMMTDKLRELYDPDIAEQYLADLNHHIIYKHDETHSQLPYCASITLYPFLHDGLSKLGGISSAPKNLEAFCGSFINLVFAVAAQLAGAVATPEWLCYLDYFIRKKFGDDYISRADELVDLSKNGRTIDKVITDCFEQTVYSLNQPAAARGYQATFWNVAYFDKPYFEEIFRDFVFPDGDEPKWETVSWLQKRFMKWFNAERLRSPLTFPVETMNLLDNGTDYVDQEWADFAAEMYAEGHSFFTYRSDSVDSLASCCYTGDTKVIIKDSKGCYLTPFEEIPNMKFDSNGYKIFNNGKWSKGKLVVLPNRPIYKVALSNGAVMKVTDNHRNNCFGGMKLTTELTTDDYIMMNSTEVGTYPEKDEKLTYEQGFIVGAFLGDGSLGSTRIIQGEEVIYETVYSLSEKKELIVPTIREGCAQMGVNVHGMKNNSLVISSRKLVEFITRWTNWKRGTKAFNKTLNMDCLLQSPQFRLGILEGWLYTDGNMISRQTNNSLRGYTTSESLIECMEALCTSLGYITSRAVDRRVGETEINGKVYNKNYPLHCLLIYKKNYKQKAPKEACIFRDNSYFFKVQSIEPFEYEGPVYCFEMSEENDDKFTLANGIHNYNCRLRNGLQNNVFSYTLGAGGISTGSKCVITLNINRIVQDAVRAGKDISEAVKEVTRRVHKYLTAYNEMIKDNLKAGLLPLYDAGFIDMKRQYLTVGFNGLVEAAEFLGIDVAVNDDYKEFTNKILKPIYELNQEDRTEELMFNTEYVPSLICGDCAA